MRHLARRTRSNGLRRLLAAGRRRLRGVTLLELLVVIALLLALLAIALPFTLRSLEARELESTEENIATELIKARVKAQESGRPVEVVVEEAPPRVIVRYFREDDIGPAPPDEPSTGTSSESSAGSRSDGAGLGPPWFEEAWLHPSVSVGRVPVANGDEADSGKAPAAEAPRGGNPVRLAVYLPDGTTLFAATLLLMHHNGLSSRVSVDPWTGQPAIRRGPAPGQPALQAPEDDEIDGDAAADDGADDAATDEALDEFERESGR